MSYQKAVDYIESLSPTLLKPGLDRFAEFMREQGNLQNTYPCVHITGTNGKGSVVAVVEATLRAAGLKTGRFIGPHLLRFNERFHISGQPISNERMAELTERLKDLSEDFGRRHPHYGSLTWFEFLTAIAFFYFAESKIDCAVIEVGLGGKWDATNVIERPLASAIVSVGLDHTHILGNTIKEIAREKAGIIKPGVPVVTACRGEALDEIVMRADKLEAPVTILESVAPLQVAATSPLPAGFDKKLAAALDRLALSGEYQRGNAALAAVILAVCQEQKTFKTSLVEAIEVGFKDVFWPGRFQYFKSQELLLDGAHNVDGIEALKKSLDKEFLQRKRFFVLSFYENKDVQKMLSTLLRPGDVVYASQAKGHRPVFTAADLVSLCGALGIRACLSPSIEEAFATAFSEREPDTLIVGTGSFATVKAGFNYLGFNTVEDSRQI